MLKSFERDPTFWWDLLKQQGIDTTQITTWLRENNMYDVIYVFLKRGLKLNLIPQDKPHLEFIEYLLSSQRCLVTSLLTGEKAYKHGVINPRYDTLDPIIACEYGINKLNDNIMKLLPSNPFYNVKKYKTRIVAFSDTHGEHEKLNIPQCEILICCGDVTNGDLATFFNFLNWFDNQPAMYKIYVPGNNDSCFWKVKDTTLIPQNIFCLDRRGITITHNGEKIKIYGAPFIVYRSNSKNNAFSMYRRDSKFLAEGIPADTDILVTHGPPYGIGDLNMTFLKSAMSGDYALRNAFYSRNIKYHIFGHVHDGKGLYVSDKLETIFANVARTMIQF